MSAIQSFPFISITISTVLIVHTLNLMFFGLHSAPVEEKGLRVNAGKTKIMICGTGLDLLQSSGEFPCAVVSHWSGQQQHFLQRL